GQINKTFECRTCEKQIVKRETFMHLFLPLPDQSSEINLDACLQLFFSERRVMGNCLMPSPNCQERSETFVKLKIVKLPKILLIALKRFGTVGEGHRCGKINAKVRFPIRMLDLSRFVDGPSQNTYNMYAVSNHNGTLASGHYWACCRNPENQCWYEFNDSVVHMVSEQYVEKSNRSSAYVLYYESVDQSTRTPDNSSGSKPGDE
ncbi:hypothetical protein DPMN_155907, partial [Dreissena polymorpha]